MMKIMWFASYPIYLIPGIKIQGKLKSHPSSWIVNLAKELSSLEEVELHIATFNPKIKSDTDIFHQNIHFHIIKNGIPYIHRGYPSYFPWNAMTGFSSEVRKLKKLVQQINPDLVHAHGTENAYALAGVKSKYPCLISIQGIINEIYKIDPSFRAFFLKRTERKAIQKGKHFAYRTEFDKNFIKKYNPTANLHLLYEAMNTAYFQSHHEYTDAKTLLFVGSLLKRKGIEVLLESIYNLKTQIPSIKAIIIGCGDNDYTAIIKSKIQHYRLEHHVELCGNKTPEEIVCCMESSSALVFPSFIENSPNAVAEAMAAGLPVIACNSGGIPSMIENDKNGILVEPADVKALSDAISKLLSDTDKAMQMGKEAKAIAYKRHYPSFVGSMAVDLYKKIIYQ
jgi:glycosyltransferase involved in cell wall biosynthesis